ncbi:hypothetical protein H6G33_18120 [Calothrix sp. FACHB-1219]|uniref:hypothetical protein n=1 Tax=unclassified Calothrix TaxID=2619626 RepID=UPI001684C1A1|nr:MULTISPECIES: hypothetical protein [unclassified Calothrix]MBD2202793.1 hypothetical protein [Calothrix sp. FACHB-168]MBD2218946.1 hypothetical protein [Calothrix sp. FACHB-1219]
MIATKKTLMTAVLFFSSCLLVSETKAIADMGVFPQEQREIPVSGYFLNEAQRRCNNGNNNFCNRIQHLTNEQQQHIRQQENARNIPYISLCQLNKPQLHPLPSQPQISQITQIPCLPK